MSKNLPQFENRIKNASVTQVHLKCVLYSILKKPLSKKKKKIKKTKLLHFQGISCLRQLVKVETTSGKRQH